jgi:hypothetical protein
LPGRQPFERGDIPEFEWPYRLDHPYQESGSPIPPNQSTEE